MAATKREREQARKQQAKWAERQARARARRRRTWALVAIFAVLALVGGTALVAGLGGEAGPAGPASSAAAAATPAAAAGGIADQDSTIPPDAEGGYTVLGTVTSGLDAVQAVADAGETSGAGDGAPVNPVIIEGVETQ